MTADIGRHDTTNSRTQRSPLNPGATKAEDFAQAQVNERSIPGKRSLAYEVGEPFIDQRGHGICHGRAGQPGCFLDDAQRDALIADFRANVTTAAGNYKGALQSLEVEKLIEKDEDVSWVISLALDRAWAHIVGALARAVNDTAGTVFAQSRARKALRELGHSQESSWKIRVENRLAAITPEKIEATTKAAFDPAKAAGKRWIAKAASDAPNASERRVRLSYIDQLKDGCDVAFRRFALDEGSVFSGQPMAPLYAPGFLFDPQPAAQPQSDPGDPLAPFRAVNRDAETFREKRDATIVAPEDRIEATMKHQRLFVALGFALLIAAIVVLVVKTRRLSEARDELAWHVDMCCSSLAQELRSAARVNAEGAQYLSHPELNDDQRRAVDQGYFTSPIVGDVTTSGRFAAGSALSHHFHFCLYIRDADNKKLDELSDRFEHAREDLRYADERAAMAKAVADMAELATIAKNLPLRERRTPSPLD